MSENRDTQEMPTESMSSSAQTTYLVVPDTSEPSDSALTRKLPLEIFSGTLTALLTHRSDAPFVYVRLSLRQLDCLVEYNDLFELRLVRPLGFGFDVSQIWSNTASSLPVLTFIDASERVKALADATANAGQSHHKTSRERYEAAVNELRSASRASATEEDDEEPAEF